VTSAKKVDPRKGPHVKIDLRPYNEKIADQVDVLMRAADRLDGERTEAVQRAEDAEAYSGPAAELLDTLRHFLETGEPGL
jgi:hypothetical protein